MILEAKGWVRFVLGRLELPLPITRAVKTQDFEDILGDLRTPLAVLVDTEAAVIGSPLGSRGLPRNTLLFERLSGKPG